MNRIVTYIVKWNDMGSISRAEALKEKLENEGYTLKHIETLTHKAIYTYIML